LKVLIVDNEGFVAELVGLALEADGHECLTAANLASAGEILRSVRVDLLAVDLLFDGRSVIDWLEEVILSHADLHGRIVILSGGLVGAAEAPRIRACGARVVKKPFTLVQLRETVRMLVPGGSRPDRPRPKSPEAES
jgi:two-component system, OmpR family, response regulator